MKIAWVVFAKVPGPGFVKTRLAEVLGEDAAQQVYRLLLRWQWQNLQSLRAAYKRDGFFIYTALPPGLSFRKGRQILKTITPSTHARIRLQPAGSLGDKLAAASSECLKKFDAVVIWGADIPLLTIEHFSRVRLILEQEQKNCIIPATDGGYCLISFLKHQYTPEAMQNISWSTDKTLKMQLDRFEACNLAYRLLAPVPDLDQARDIALNILYMKKKKYPAYELRSSELEKLFSMPGQA